MQSSATSQMKGSLATMGHERSLTLGGNQGGLPGRSGFWMEYLRAALNGGVVHAGVHRLLPGRGLPLTKLAPSS